MTARVSIRQGLLRRRNAPMPVKHPSTLLAFLAAVLRPPASATLGKLACELLPFPALVVCTLSDAPTAVVLAAQVAHHHASPVLHVLAVVSDRELFDQRENVEVVWEQVLFLFGIASRGGAGRGSRR